MEEYIDPFPFFFDNEETNQEHERTLVVKVKFPFHKHPLYPTKVPSNICVGCCGRASDDPDGGYACDESGRDCDEVYVHKHCLEVTNPSHPTHPIPLGPHSSFKCFVCLDHEYNMGYSYPFSGKVSACKVCARKELYIDPKKSHEHPLFVLLKGFFSFSCDACGCNDDSSCLCLCLPCRFTIHRQCVDLPRVICINRHDHRISHVPRLGPGKWGCGVCRTKIDRRYGAYSCSTCSFAVHSRCATREDLWDGIDLEGVPEDDPEDIMPFKVVKAGVIKHFGHEYNLRFHTEDDDGHEKHKQCYACMLPIFSDPCYICIHCNFVLHESCANLPKKKRHISHQKQFILYTDISPFTCMECGHVCSGFAYKVRGLPMYLDLRCILIYDGYVHKSQLDSMLLAPRGDYHYSTCSSCGVPGCDLLIFSGRGNLFLCYKCATMPAQAIYQYDDHLLSLRFTEDAIGDYWCEICEKIVDSGKWFYTCDECCITVHTICLLGWQPYLRVGSTFGFTLEREELIVELVSNNFASRPSCTACLEGYPTAASFSAAWSGNQSTACSEGSPSTACSSVHPSTARIADPLFFKSKDGISFCLEHFSFLYLHLRFEYVEVDQEGTLSK